jgi:hypothetical protein
LTIETGHCNLLKTRYTIVNDIEAQIVDLIAHHPCFPPSIRVQSMTSNLVESGRTTSVENVTVVYQGLNALKQANSMNVLSQNYLVLQWKIYLELFSSNLQMAPTVVLELLRALLTGFAPLGTINPLFVGSERPSGFDESGLFTWAIDIEATVQQCTFTYYDANEQPDPCNLSGETERGINLCWRRVFDPEGKCYIMNACNPEGGIIQEEARVNFGLYVSTSEEIGPDPGRALLLWKGDNKAYPHT